MPFPSFNGIEKELFGLREGHGLAIFKIEKINGAPNLLSALGVPLDGSEPPSDRALAAREALKGFVDGCGALTPDYKVALTYVLNLDEDAKCYNARLSGRRDDLETALAVGRRRRANAEERAIRSLAEQLFRASRQRA